MLGEGCNRKVKRRPPELRINSADLFDKKPVSKSEDTQIALSANNCSVNIGRPVSNNFGREFMIPGR